MSTSKIAGKPGKNKASKQSAATRLQLYAQKQVENAVQIRKLQQELYYASKIIELYEKGNAGYKHDAEFYKDHCRFKQEVIEEQKEEIARLKLKLVKNNLASTVKTLFPEQMANQEDVNTCLAKTADARIQLVTSALTHFN